MPYTSLYLSGLGIGMDSLDMRTMPLPRLVLMVRAHNEMSEPPEPEAGGEDVRDATQADINALLM